MGIASHGLRLQRLLRRRLSTITSIHASSSIFSYPVTSMSAASSTAAGEANEEATTQRTTSPLNHDTPHVPIPGRGVDYRGKIVLAPMVRSGELPSRLLALKYGADLVWGPETVDRSMIGCTKRTNPRTGCIEWSRNSNNQNPDAPAKESIIYRIDPKRESDKLIYQIGTASPEFAVDAAKLVAPYVCGIDVNAGCPKPF